jgi:Xaa-Pro aminopeptidase
MVEDLRRERLREPVSRSELERRWRTVRAAMEREGLDCLVMQNSNLYLGGYVRYFTDIPAENGYPLSVVFPIDDEITVISHGGKPLPTTPPEWALYGVKERIALPYLPTLNFTDSMEAEAVVGALKGYEARKIGLLSKASMSAALYEGIRERLHGVEIRDATNMVEEVKAVKSEEEIGLIRKTIELQDKTWAAALAYIRPGVREYELRSFIQWVSTNLGSEEHLISIGSAPAGKPAGQVRAFFQNRLLQRGDQICVMIEVNGPGGFYGEIARTACIGEAPRQLLKVWDDAVEVQDRDAELTKPGADPPELFALHNELLSGMGYPPEGRLHSHGQGYDLVERPAIRPEETMKVRENMNIVIHPITLTGDAYAFCCDNYLVTGLGAVRLHRTPREIFVV